MHMQTSQQHAPGRADNRDERRANGPARRAVLARGSGPRWPEGPAPGSRAFGVRARASPGRGCAPVPCYRGTGSVAVASARDRLVVKA